mmetsp:Transcript_7148/g.10388  ORF Transcript_7148/g.10388 Transcript_7148/m.10388 type:complete len:180 (+) Transcript_7148:124-663(+)|eukprot:CAMPEP_0172415144 /NCGR_PEP_ID=MMETSP1064-20121228/1644_1 /TAXON_ID=202472 /ORGANISM="Aulacoseira subarctica , Strain CCAP 1002/5" /LENGTH=179 /DNA_ID=CAMNT_0013152049 /DNA_START=123 /DNA_END=662 /DNA_ORIENTATION=+
MFSSDLRLPVMPVFAVRETNWDTLLRLGRDLTLVGNNQLSAADSYRFYWYDEQNRGTWGCGVEAARVDNSEDILVLMRSDEGASVDKALSWMSLSKLYTRKHALLFYEVTDTEGPTEEAMFEILQVFRDVFEFAVATNWSYHKRLEFYHAFPFEELTTKEAVMSFRPVLFGCPAFAEFE